MIPLELLGAFFVSALLLALVPGPDNLYVLTQSALHGRKAGLAVTLGLCTGLLAHTGAVAGGVALVVQNSAVAFTALKLLGAAYLLYLAWQALRAGDLPLGGVPALPLPAGRLYRRGIAMNVTNPKVTLFLLAFLPQFADPGRGPLPPQMILLGGLFILATVLVFGAIALLAGSLGAWLGRSLRVQRLMHRATAALFAGLAFYLASAQS